MKEYMNGSCYKNQEDSDDSSCVNNRHKKCIRSVNKKSNDKTNNLIESSCNPCDKNISSNKSKNPCDECLISNRSKNTCD